MKGLRIGLSSKYQQALGKLVGAVEGLGGTYVSPELTLSTGLDLLIVLNVDTSTFLVSIKSTWS